MRLTNVLCLERMGLDLLFTNALEKHNIHTTFETENSYLIGAYTNESMGTGLKRLDVLYKILDIVKINPAVKEDRAGTCRSTLQPTVESSEGIKL